LQTGGVIDTGGGWEDAFVAKISLGGAAPAVSFSPTSLTFAPQGLGTTSGPQMETVTNTGTTNLSIMTVTIGGTNAGDFTKTADTCTGATLTPIGTCTVSVTYTPSALGSRSASLIFTDNAANSPQTVTLTGTSPVAGVSPPSLTFDVQALGTTSGPQSVNLSNTGNGALTVANIATSANFGQTNNCAGSVAPGGSCTINVTFSPTATVPLIGTLTITDNSNDAAGSTQTLKLTGTGVPPVPLANVFPSSLTFLSQDLGPLAYEIVALTNTGTAPLTVSSVVASAAFAQTNNCIGSLAPGTGCIITVGFTPTSTLNTTGALTITDNAANSPQTVALSGSGTPATLAVLNLTSLVFGDQAENTSSAPQTITLTNTQNTALAVSSITASGDFGQTNTCHGGVPAKNGQLFASCTISVTYTPSMLGPETGTLTVIDNASNSPQTVSLSGKGIAQAAVAPNSLWLGAQAMGSPSPAVTVMMTNNLPTALPFSITFTGADPGDFAQTNTCGASLAAQSSCTLSVTFTPTAAGTRTATMNVNDSANNSPQMVALKGVGQ
jgi:hypothetical protein